MEIHEAAKLFPMMDERRFSELIESIREQGQREPITVCEGKILDGRNRAKACEALSIEVKAKTFDGDPYAYVWDLNGQRRDLTADQRYLIWKAANEKSEQWQARQRELAAAANRKRSESQKGVPKGERANTSSVNTLGDPNVGQVDRATASHTNRGAVQRMDQLAARRPDLAEKVRTGELKSTQALRIMRRDELSDRVAALPEGKYRVLYADPPWQYGDERVGLEGYDQSAAEGQYPTMSVAELCALDVKSLAAEDSVLFCWATFPLYPDALEVVRAWGFKYKTALVWNKERPNVGNYHDASAELLLITTRGSCLPEVRPKQVQVIAPGRHSVKPEHFRALIDEMYPLGPRVELFRRGAAPEGWIVWGNEAA